MSGPPGKSESENILTYLFTPPNTTQTRFYSLRVFPTLPDSPLPDQTSPRHSQPTEPRLTLEELREDAWHASNRINDYNTALVESMIEALPRGDAIVPRDDLSATSDKPSDEEGVLRPHGESPDNDILVSRDDQGFNALEDGIPSMAELFGGEVPTAPSTEADGNSTIIVSSDDDTAPTELDEEALRVTIPPPSPPALGGGGGAAAADLAAPIPIPVAGMCLECSAQACGVPISAVRAAILAMRYM